MGRLRILLLSITLAALALVFAVPSEAELFCVVPRQGPLGVFLSGG